MLALLLALAPGGLAAQPTPPPPADSVETRFVFDPLSLYRPSGGFGVGGRFEATHLGWPGSQLTVEAYLAQHRGDYAVTFAPRDLLRDGLASAFTVRYETQGRLPYYGLGPRTTDNVRLFVDADLFSAGAFVGLRRGAVGVLGSVRGRSGALYSYKNDTDDAFDRLDERSAFVLEASVDERVQGASAGGVLYADTRDHAYRPTRGVLAWAGADVFAGSPEAVFQPVASLTGHLPLGRSILTGRALVVFTRPLGNGPVPLMLVPRFDNRFALVPSARLAGRDLALVDVTFQHPVALPYDPRLVGELSTDVFVLVGAFNAYDDLFAEARWAPSWRARFDGRGRTPLRALVGAGLHTYNPQTRKPFFTAGLGLSADGIALSTLTFSLDPRQLRPLWRW